MHLQRSEMVKVQEKIDATPVGKAIKAAQQKENNMGLSQFAGKTYVEKTRKTSKVYGCNA